MGWIRSIRGVSPPRGRSLTRWRTHLNICLSTMLYYHYLKNTYRVNYENIRIVFMRERIF